MVRLESSPRRVTTRLIAFLAVLDLAYAITQFVHFRWGIGMEKYPIHSFNFDIEQALPTFFRWCRS